MKKILIILTIVLFSTANLCSAASVYNAKTKSAMQMYKNKNYTECLQVMFDVINEDPSNVLAYYYIAISQARLGETSKAKEAYQRVIDLNTSTQLTRYAKNGIDCLNDPSMCKSTQTVDATQKTLSTINKQMEEQKIETVRGIINQKQNIQDVPIEYIREFKDFSKPQNQLQNKSEVPTNDEVLAALDTLKRAGYQNYMPQPAMTSEMMQMNMLMGNNQNSMNPMMNFMPYISNSQNSNQFDPQIFQTMMMGSMMNGLYNNFDNK